MAKGWIKLYRQIQDNPLWDEKPFTRGQAWVDILLSVNHENKEVIFNGNSVTVKRGQMITSIRKLAERWGWGKDKVSRFLQTQTRTGSIATDTDTHRTLITVIKWDSFQGRSDTDKDTNKDTKADTDAIQTRKEERKEEKNNCLAVVLNEDCSNQAEYDSDRLNHPIAAGWLIDDDGFWRQE